MLKKNKPINKRITLTDNDPTFMLADSNARAVIVQNIAVKRAASSPKLFIVVSISKNNGQT